MKTGSKILVALIILGAIVYKSCTKPDPTGVNERVRNGSASSTSTTPIVIAQWKISFFKKSQVDQTATFNNDAFTFNRDGSMIAFNNGIKTKGTWSIGGNDNPNFLRIEFPIGTKYALLNGGWNITLSDNLQMITEQPGSDSLRKDRLNFEKIERVDSDPTLVN